MAAVPSCSAVRLGLQRQRNDGMTTTARRIFISYKRGHDDAFARALAEDLRAAGHDVWKDTDSMPSRGRTFNLEIRDAIAERDTLVLVYSGATSDSPYVDAEWRFARHICKPVVPILRGIGPESLPRELRNHHALQAGPSTTPTQLLIELRRVLADCRLPIAPLFGVPALPPWYRARTGPLEELALALLPDSRGPVAPVEVPSFVLLGGPAGLGKSVIASAFASSCEARASFPDGVVWLDVPAVSEGQLLFDLLVRAGARIGAADGCSDWRAAADALRRGARDRVVLFVLDDARSDAVIEAFVNSLQGSRCRLLVTAQDRSLARSGGAHIVPVELLESNEAAELFRSTLVDEPQTNGALDAIVNACAGLPLALAVCGRTVAGGHMSLEEVAARMWAGDLGAVVQKLHNYPHPTVARALEVSLSALEPSERERYEELVVAPRGERLSMAVVARLWRHTARYSPRETCDLLARLGDRSLLYISGSGDVRDIWLHDLHHDYLLLTGAPALAHTKLLDAYKSDPDVAWRDVPDDGYLHDHLTFHLACADRGQELRALVCRSWAERQLARTKSPSHFARDARIAFAHAHDDPAALAHAAYMLAAGRDIGASVPAPIIIALARLPTRIDRALGFAVCLPEGWERSHVLLEIAVQLLGTTDTDGALSLVEQGLAENEPAIEPIHHKLVLAMARAGLVDQAHQLAWLLRRSGHGQGRELLIRSAVKSLLAEGRREIAVHLGSVAKCSVADELVAALVAHNTRDAEAWARTLEDNTVRARSLASIGRHLAATGDLVGAARIAQDIEEAAAAFGTVEPEWILREAPPIHAARGDHAAMWRVLQTLSKEDGLYRIQALSKCVPILLAREELEEALQVTRAIRDDIYYPHVALSVVAALERRSDSRARELMANLSGAHQSAAWVAIARAAAEDGRLETARQLAETLPEAERAEILAAVGEHLARLGRFAEALPLVFPSNSRDTAVLAAAIEVARETLRRGEPTTFHALKAAWDARFGLSVLKSLAEYPLPLPPAFEFLTLLPPVDMDESWWWWAPDAVEALMQIAESSGSCTQSEVRATARTAARDLARACVDAIRAGAGGDFRPCAVAATVQSLLRADPDARGRAERLLDAEISSASADREPIARALVGLQEACERLCCRQEESAQHNVNNETRARAVSLGMTGDVDGALVIARSLRLHLQPATLADLARTLARHGHRESAARVARETAALLAQNTPESIAIEPAIAASLAEAGGEDVARLLATVHDPPVSALAYGLARAGKLAAARFLAAGRPDVHAAIIRGLAEAGHADDALFEADRAFAAFKSANTRQTLADRRVLAPSLAEAGEFTLAERALGLNIFLGLDGDDFELMSATVAVAEVLVRKQRLDDAERLIKQLRDRQCGSRSDAQKRLAFALARAGHCERAVDLVLDTEAGAPVDTIAELLDAAVCKGHHAAARAVLTSLCSRGRG